MLTDDERAFLRWALDRWPDADLLPLASPGSDAAEVIALEQDEAKKRRAKTRRAVVTRVGFLPGVNASCGIPPIGAKDALRTVPHGGAAASDNPLNNKGNSNASFSQSEPTASCQVRTMPIVQRKGNGADLNSCSDPERLDRRDSVRNPGGASISPPADTALEES